MKKRIISFILVLMLLPISSLFVACGKDEGYNLNNLSADFYNVEQENNNVKIVEDKIVFDYIYQTNLYEAVLTSYPYTELSNYNKVFENLMAFTFEYIDECSNNAATSDKALKQDLQQKVINFKTELLNVNACTNMLEEIINVSGINNIQDQACLTRLENLFKSYDGLYSAGYALTNALYYFYYNNILSDANPDVYVLNASEFKVEIIINKLKSRLSYQVSRLSQSFVERNIDGGIIAEEIINNHATLDLNKDNYLSSVSKVNVDFDEEIAISYANTQKAAFYAEAVKLHNIIETIESDDTKHITACNTVSYLSVKQDALATAEEVLCVDIIDANFESITEFNEILVAILNLIK